MKKHLLLPTILLIFLSACAPAQAAPSSAQQDEDLAVYRAVLAYFGYTYPVVNEQAAYRGFTDVGDLVDLMGGAVSQETAQAFLKTSARPMTLTQTLAGDPSVAILTARESEEIFASDPIGGWEEFHRRYSGKDPALVSLSPVGYNAAHTEALVAIGHAQGAKAGVGGYVVLKKVNNQWQVTTEKELWKS